MTTGFDWKRFWCPRGKTINLSDGGFLYDPESEYGKHLNPDLVTFDRLTEKPCLALLGEPGIGKSWALEAERASLDSFLALNGARSFWLNLRSFGSEDRLWKDLFEADEFKEWRKSDYLLYLFLDSLDECLLRIDNVATLIADQLPKEPASRLRFRIACRTAPWPAILENALTEVFGRDGFEAYELAPLRRRDMQQALEQSGVASPEDFSARVEALDVSSFAIKPVTLKFLINTYLRDGSLPVNQFDLYEKGCRILCEESNESRTASGKRGMLTPEHRFAIASRIAAITQFCSRFAVYTEGEATAIPPEDISINDIVGSEQVGTAELAVSPESIREVLDTGLFSSRGPGRIGWAHQTYAEFLAAHYCVRREMPKRQIQSLILHPAGGSLRLIPQLYDLAAWISVKRPDVFEIVASSDPESLLGSAGASLSESQRKLVVQSLLNQCEKGRLLNLHWNLYQLYPKLSHLSLAEQLRPYLRDEGKSVNTKQVVVDIARACRVQQLGPELADIALYGSPASVLRIRAGAAAADIGSQEVKARLRPFALGEAGDDPDDELKGIGLTALWPDLMSSPELFSLLTRPKNRSLHGAYSSFLYGLVSTLKSDDLPAALEWFAGQQQRDMGPIDSLMDDIIHFALAGMEAPNVLAKFTKAILSRVKLHDQLMSGHDEGNLTKKLCRDHKRRQVLLRELMPQLASDEFFFLDYAGVKVVPESDLPWLINRIDSGESGASEETEIKFVRRIVDTRHPDQMRLLWFACETNASLNAECKDLFVILLDSESVRMLRENLKYQQKREEKFLDPLPQIRILQDLMNIEQGKVSEWMQLTRDLSLKPTSTRWSSDRDLTVLPGWESSDGETKDRIISAAFRYVNEGDPENDKWFNTSETYYSAIGGFQALSLLFSVAPVRLADVPTAAWAKWVPILLKYHSDETGKQKLQPLLVQAAYSRVPEEVISRVKQAIDSDNDCHGYLFISREIDLCWDEQLRAALLAKAREPHLKQAVVSSLLQLLLEHGVIGSRELAQSFIRLPPPDSDPGKATMVAAIEALTSSTDDAGWSGVWPVIRDYPEFGRDVVGSISYRHGGHANFLQKLSEAQLGDLYAWMLANYPPSSHDHKVSGAVAPSQTAIMFRDHTLQLLKKRATFAACEAIRDVMERYPEYPWLRLHFDESEYLARAATWQPTSVQEFLKLAQNQNKRMVETGEQLLEVIFESLDRLQIRMQDELPAAMHLWTSPTGKNLQPKYEEDLSDYVALHLRDDLRKNGIVVNREVQIRRRPGQKTDIHVDAVIPGHQATSFESVHAIIEVKGDWNSGVGTAMETQLRNGYLKANRLKYGLYLVGWFYCDQWDRLDNRKKACPKISLQEARLQFEAQADALSTQGYKLKSYVLDVRAS